MTHEDVLVDTGAAMSVSPESYDHEVPPERTPEVRLNQPDGGVVQHNGGKRVEMIDEIGVPMVETFEDKDITKPKSTQQNQHATQGTVCGCIATVVALYSG